MSSRISPETAARARELRADGATYAEIRKALGIGSSSTVSRILGIAGTGRSPGPRLRVREETREKAREMRHAGSTVPEISRELGIARSTAWSITKDVDWAPGLDTATRRSNAAKYRWRSYEERRTAEREAARCVEAEHIGEVSDRELGLIGAVLYWAEGTKSKPWNRRENLQFINSDPDVIELHLAWLRLLGVPKERMSFRVNIHESADIAAAEEYWSEIVGIERAALQRTTLKRHIAKTVRKNTGEEYQGCLVVRVGRSAREYWRMEDAWAAIARSVGRRSAAD